MKNILITGCRGFIGFNAVRLWKKERPEYGYVSLDAGTYADRIFETEKNEWLDSNGVPRYVVDLGSDGAAESLAAIIERHGIDAVVHMGCESHVDNSIKNPEIFFRSNVLGTSRVLEAARKFGLRTHVVSTDEVYGETSPESWAGRIRPEEKPLVPSSPYSSSKAAADLIAVSYRRTFGVETTVSRCTNNAGEFQHPEKLIGTVVSKALKNEKIPVYGDGSQRRHWIDVNDHNRAVMKILEEGEPGKIYNVGAGRGNWTTNLELVRFVLGRLGRPDSLIERVEDRPGHDTTYFLENTVPGFEAADFREFMPRVVDWYAEKLKR